LGKTNLGRMDKSKVVLDYKFEHTNRELDEMLTCRRGAPGVRGCLNRGRPSGLGGVVPSLAQVFSSTLIFTL
jgi:hypothetical protein